MVELGERELLLGSLKGYLEELAESGVDELSLAAESDLAAAAEAPGSGAVQVEPSPAPIGSAGKSDARLAFVMTGEGFAGASGSLLSRIIMAMGFAPQDVLLLTLPEDGIGDKAMMREALLDRIAMAAPEVVVALGESAAHLLAGTAEPISTLRGRFIDLSGSRMMATLHPDQLVADEALKREVWNEMKQVIAFLARGR